MALILHIDTSSSVGNVSIARDGKLLAFLQNDEQKEHASYLQPAIKKIVEKLSIKLSDLDAVAVANGPGSYTGLRVGLSSAKGLSYSLNKPLITINSLQMMARAAIDNNAETLLLFCPMIDARRMEVFTAIYNNSLNEILSTAAKVLDNNSFEDLLLRNKILFFGNGSEKFKSICNHPHALFSDGYLTNEAMTSLAFLQFKSGSFADMPYCEPLYGKAFYTGTPVK